MATVKQMQAKKNFQTVLLIITTIVVCLLSFIKEDVYIFGILGSLLYAAPFAFWVLLVAIRIRWVGKYMPSLKFIFLAILPLVAYGRIALSTPDTDIEKQGLRFASYNVNRFVESQIDERLKMLEQVDADILSLIEVNKAWETRLKDYTKAYPFTHKDKSLTGTNMLLSKYPIKKITKYDDGYILAYQIELPSKTIDVVQLHPMPPMGQNLTEKRNNTLEIASKIELDEFKVFLGDFNTVAWQKPVKNLLSKQGLRVATKHDATWPVPMPASPIDHILTSFNLTYKGHGKVCMWGSDHCLLYTDASILGTQ